jgi:transposase-like protein
LRKVTKNRSLFPNDDALTKILYLALQDVINKWTMPLAILLHRLESENGIFYK